MVDLDTQKKKYQAVIDYGQKRGVSWKNIHIENNKLLIRGAAPSGSSSNRKSTPTASRRWTAPGSRSPG